MLQNFRVIMKYNPAEAYALAIGHLADRLAGGGPLIQSWPRDERALTIAERLELQQLLVRRGYDVGEPDGLLGPRTRIAIRNFQVAAGQIPDGFRLEPRARPPAPAVSAFFIRFAGPANTDPGFRSAQSELRLLSRVAATNRA